tara:strand:+ start:234 stop:794 length:561 start_codon:yes stop_codon:yes gene_type:complete
MQVKKNEILGFYTIKPKIFSDERGYFFESYNKDRYEKILNTESFVQDDHSFSGKNVLRGIHFQTHNPQAQLLYLVTGKIFFVIVDFRINSKTFLQHESMIINSENHLQVYMSPGIGCGFYTLSENVNIIYKISKLYGQSNEIGIAWNDKDLKIDWPCTKPILSKKDMNNFCLKDINFEEFEDLMIL